MFNAVHGAGADAKKPLFSNVDTQNTLVDAFAVPAGIYFASYAALRVRVFLCITHLLHSLNLQRNFLP